MWKGLDRKIWYSSFCQSFSHCLDPGWCSLTGLNGDRVIVPGRQGRAKASSPGPLWSKSLTQTPGEAHGPLLGRPRHWADVTKRPRAHACSAYSLTLCCLKPCSPSPSGSLVLPPPLVAAPWVPRAPSLPPLPAVI